TIHRSSATRHDTPAPPTPTDPFHYDLRAPAKHPVLIVTDAPTTETYTLSLHDALPIYDLRATKPEPPPHRREHDSKGDNEFVRDVGGAHVGNVGSHPAHLWAVGCTEAEKPSQDPHRRLRVQDSGFTPHMWRRDRFALVR